jgi:hypothetical protein
VLRLETPLAISELVELVPEVEELAVPLTWLVVAG